MSLQQIKTQKRSLGMKEVGVEGKQELYFIWSILKYMI